MLVRLLALSATLWGLLQAPPDPYGLPPGIKPDSTDTTATDGTRTITYEKEDGTTVEVVIELDGSTTETHTSPDGTKTTRQYETIFNGDGTRTEVHEDTPGTIRRKTVDGNGKTRITETIESKSVDGDSTRIRRTIRRTVDDENGKRREVTTITEEEGLLPNLERGIFVRETRTEILDADGKRTGLIRETIELKEFDERANFPIYEGTRTTQTKQPDGSIQTTRERMDPNTQQWGPDQPKPKPEPEPEPGPITESPARRAGYLALAPGIIHIALPNAVGYQWGVRGGVELPCGGPCSVAVGPSFQHSVGSANAHQLRAQAELMPGARLVDDKLFVFVDLGIGYVGNLSSYQLAGETMRTTNHGVAFSVGAGVNYVVWRELFVGGRFGADLQWFPSGSGTFAAHNLALEAVVGWRFEI